MNQKTKPASALIFTLIILFIGVVSAIGIASSTLIARKMSTTSGKSVASFQVADSGAEIVLQKMKDTLDSDSNAKITDMGLSCNNGTVSGNISSGKEYKITFLDENGNQLSAGCSAPISDVQKIRSIGTYAQISRAIEAAVAAGEGYQTSCDYAKIPGENTWACCRMDTGNGITECKATNDAVTWKTYTSPWNSSSSGEFEISCSYAKIPGENTWACCRTHLSNGTVECKATNDAVTWKTYTSPWN